MLALHVTPRTNLPSIRLNGLVPQAGPRASQLNEQPGIWLFPDWQALDDAQWLWDLFPEDEALAIIAVDLGACPHVPTEVGYEVVIRHQIAPAAIAVLCEDVEDTTHGEDAARRAWHNACRLATARFEAQGRRAA